MQQVAIIAGAGPAGLTAAYELLKRTDIIPIVFEETDAIGGIAQTFLHHGHRMDIGPHRYYSKSDRVMRWWFNILPPQGKPASDDIERHHDVDYVSASVQEYLCVNCTPPSALGSTTIKRTSPDPELEDDILLHRPRFTRILHHRYLFPYPVAITFSVIRKLGVWNTFLILLSYLRTRIFPLRDETYLDAFYINRFGKRLYQTFFERYTEKVWGIPCSQIRAEWGAQRVKGLSLFRALEHAVKDFLVSDFRRVQEERETSLITRFHYPKFGSGQMWETVAAQVERCGGQVHRGRRVCGVHLRGSTVAAVTVEDLANGRKERVPCDFFFSSMPVKDLVAAMDPVPPAPVCALAVELSYRDFIMVGLLVKKLSLCERGQLERLPIISDNWIYIQEDDVSVGRVEIYNNWSPYLMKDPRNTVWIGLEYFVNEGKGLWLLSDEEIIGFGIAEMEEIHFLQKEDLLDACVVRHRKTYPVYTGSYDQFPVIQSYMDGIPNLFLIGRNGQHRYNNMDHSMLTAMYAVDNILAGRSEKSNLWNVNVEKAYLEEKQAKGRSSHA